MANSLPVLTLDIDDDKLRRLEEVAKRFSEAFKVMPSGKTNPSTPGGTKPLPPGGGSVPSPSNPGNTIIDNSHTVINKAVKESNKSIKQLNKTLKQTTRIVSSLFSTALSWGVKLASFSTIGAGGFGLITYKAGESLKNAQGLGLSVTEKQAITSSLNGRVTGIEGILNDLNNAKHDVNSPIRRFQQSQGINYNNSPFDTLFPTLKAALKIANQHASAGAGLNALNSMGLNLSAVQLSQIQNLDKNGGLNRYEREVNQRERYFSGQISDKGFVGYQNLMSTFSANAYKISNAFLSTLNNLTPGLTKFSNAITKGITKFISGPNGEKLFNTIGQGLETLAKWLGSEKFQTDLKNFINLISDLVRAISKAIKWIADSSNADWNLRRDSTKEDIKKNFKLNRMKANQKAENWWSSLLFGDSKNEENFSHYDTSEYIKNLLKITGNDRSFEERYSAYFNQSNKYNSLPTKTSQQILEFRLKENPGSDFNLQWQSQIAG